MFWHSNSSNLFKVKWVVCVDSCELSTLYSKSNLCKSMFSYNFYQNRINNTQHHHRPPVPLELFEWLMRFPVLYARTRNKWPHPHFRIRLKVGHTTNTPVSHSKKKKSNVDTLYRRHIIWPDSLIVTNKHFPYANQSHKSWPETEISVNGEWGAHRKKQAHSSLPRSDK